MMLLEKRILQKISAVYILLPSLFFAWGWLRFPAPLKIITWARPNIPLCLASPL